MRRHSTWLWFLIIAATIVGLVTVFRPAANYSNAPGGSANYGSIDGQRVSQDEYMEARNEVFLRYFFTYGDWPDKAGRSASFDEMQQTYQWLFLLRKLQQYDIRVDTAAVARAANGILREFGQGQPVPFDVFVQRILLPEKISAGDFERYLRHYLGIQQLASIVGLGGKLITPQDAQALYERNYQEVSTEAVFFSGSNYLASVTATPPDAVAQFYTNEMSAYRVPELAQVSYVAFGISNLLAAAQSQLTNLNEAVETSLERVGTNYTRFAATPEEAKVKIREELIRQQALNDARRQANDFASTLFDLNPVQAANLAALAKTNGLTVQLTQPFDQDVGPTEFDGGPNFGRAAFALTPDNPFAEPIVGKDAVYVIALDKKIPSEIPPLDKIRERVTADYRYSEAVSLARRAGEAFAQTATNALAQGKTFSAVCAEAKVTPVPVPPFSLSTNSVPAVEDHLSLRQFKAIAFSTPPGKVSGFSPSSEGGVVVYVQRRLPVNVAQMKADMPAFLNSIRRERQMEAFEEWINLEAPSALRNTPVMSRKSSSATSGQPQP